MRGKALTKITAEPILDRLTGVHDLIWSLAETAELSKVSPNALDAVSDLLGGIIRDFRELTDGTETAVQE